MKPSPHTIAYSIASNLDPDPAPHQVDVAVDDATRWFRYSADERAEIVRLVYRYLEGKESA